MLGLTCTCLLSAPARSNTLGWTHTNACRLKNSTCTKIWLYWWSILLNVIAPQNNPDNHETAKTSRASVLRNFWAKLRLHIIVCTLLHTKRRRRRCRLWSSVCSSTVMSGLWAPVHYLKSCTRRAQKKKRTQYFSAWVITPPFNEYLGVSEHQVIK